MNELLDFLKSYFSKKVGVSIVVVLASALALYFLSKQEIYNQSVLFWLVVGVIFFAFIIALFLMFFFMNKKRKSLTDTVSGKMKSELKAIFKKLKKEDKNFKKTPLILFTSTEEATGDELFSRANLKLLQLNKKQDSGFSVWYSPEFTVFDVGPEFFDITSASSPLNEKFRYLLRFLKKARRYAPINSYVMSFPFNYFSHTDHSELKENAKNIAKKMEIVQRKLRIRFPAYLLIDRADLVYGFYDYAASLEHYGSKQMVGWSSDLKINEVLDEKSINNYFEEFSNSIYKPLYKEQGKLHLTTKNSGINSFCFCKTIKNIIPSLKIFVGNVFSNATWHFNPLQLRGVYFTAIKSDNRYTYMSYSDVNSQLRYYKIPADKQSKALAETKDNSVFFLEDLFRNKILKERNLIVYTDFYFLFMRILKILLSTIGVAAIFLFVYYSFTNTDNLSKEVMATKAKSWRICSNVNYWENGKFSPLLLLSDKGDYSLANSTINGKDNLDFILDFYRQNDAQINIPSIYLLSEWAAGINKQKDRARNTVLYTSIISPLMEALLKEYSVKVNKFDHFKAEIFANVFGYAKILCDYEAGKKNFFHYYLGSWQFSGLYLYLEDTYRYLLKSFDKNTDNKLKLLSGVKIGLQQLFDSSSLPYGIGRSFTKLKKSDFMANDEVYKSNVLSFIEYCIQDYVLGPKSMNLRDRHINTLLMRQFLIDAKNYEKDEEHFFQNLSIDEMVKKGRTLKDLISTVRNIDMEMSDDNKTIVMGYSIVARDQDSINADSHVLTFDATNNTIKFDVIKDFRDTLFFELGLKRNLYRNWLLEIMLTKEQDYLFSPFYEMFNYKNNNFSKKYANEVDTFKSDLLYDLALRRLIDFMSDYNKKSKDKIANNIFSLLNNKEIKYSENVGFIFPYLVEFSVIGMYLDILSKSSFPFTFNELQPNEDLIRNADKLSSALDEVLPPDVAVKDEIGKTDAQPVKFQKIIKIKQDLPPVLTQWISSAREIISFVRTNRDFVSKVYLLGTDYSKDFEKDSASNVWIAVSVEQKGADYKPVAALTRTKDNSLLDKVLLTDNKSLKIKFYRTFESLASDRPEESLLMGTLPLFKFMIDNPSPVPMFNNKYSITWHAARFNKDIGVWISKISFVFKDKKELNIYLAFTMPEGAECLRGCLESEDHKLILKKINEYQN